MKKGFYGELEADFAKFVRKSGKIVFKKPPRWHNMLKTTQGEALLL
jgi:hypothetical protein